MDNRIDNELLNSIFLLDKDKEKFTKYEENNNNTIHFIKGDVLAKFPKKEPINKFSILCPQSVDSETKGFVVISIDKVGKEIDFYANNFEKKELFMCSKLEDNNWIINNNNKSIRENLDELENKKICESDGFIYIETLRNVFGEINSIYNNANDKTR